MLAAPAGPGLAVRLGAVAGAGVVAGVGFPPWGLWWLLPLAVAVLSWAVLAQPLRRGFLLGLVFGLAFMLVLLPWLRVIGSDAWVALSLMQALFYAVLGWALAAVSRLPWWPVWSACLWVAAESARGVVPWGGFNWGRLGFAAVEAPPAALVGYAGVGAVSFLVALLGTTLAWAAGAGPIPHRVMAAVAAAVAFGLPAALPAWSATGEGTATIAAVQGNVPGEGMAAFAERRAVLDNHVRATRDLAADVDAGVVDAPDVVIWPENSTDIDPFRDPTVRADIQGAVDAVGVPVLVGAMVQGSEPADVENQGIVWLPGTGPAASYAKRHPVPFGEYIPMRGFLSRYIQRLEQIPRDMVPGTRPGVLRLGEVTIGDVICFEVIYDGLVRDVVRGGAQVLVVQTNNATYMGTGQVDQQFVVARLRARETGRYVVVAATNGISGIVDPDGNVVARAPKLTQRVLVADVPLLGGVSPGVRFGAWVELGLTAGGLAALAAALMLRRRPPLPEARRDSAADSAPLDLSAWTRR